MGMMKKNDINLLTQYREIHKERSNKNAPGRIYLAILIGALLITGAISLRLWLEQKDLKTDIADLQSYINDPSVIARMNEVVVLQKNIEDLDQMIEQVNGINEVFDSAVRFDHYPLMIMQQKRYTGINFDSLSYSKGIIYMDISGTKSSDVSNYVLRLKREAYFKDVSYSGYTYDPEANVYRSTIRCTMHGGN